MNILLFIALLLLQATSEYLIRHFTVDDGLPVNAINGIVQDADGYLYVSTYNGLVRYDGYEFELFDSGNTPNMLTNRIAGLLIASDGTLWMFNEGGTLTSKIGSTFKTYTAAEIPGLATWLIEDDDGRVWMGGANGLSSYSPENASFVKLNHEPLPSSVNVIMPSASGILYMATNDGIYSVADGVLKQILTDADVDIPFESILYLQPMGDDSIWVIGTDDVFLFDIRLDRVTRVMNRVESDMALSALSNKNNGGHILTTPTGYYLLGQDGVAYQQLVTPFSPAEVELSLHVRGKQGETILIGSDVVIIDNQVVLDGWLIKRVMVDNEGSLWIGTVSDGLYQIQKSSFTNLSAQDLPSFTNMYSIIQDRNQDIWACSFSNGIYRLSGNSHTRWTTARSKLANNFCKVVFEDDDGTIYASFNDAGLWMFKDGDWLRLSAYDAFTGDFNRSVEALHRNGSQLFVSSFNSLVVYENHRFRYFDESQPRELSGIQVFQENSRGVIFAGTEGNGISRIEGQTFRNYTTENGILNSNSIRDLLLQSDDTLWVVNESIGLNRIVLDADGDVISSASITSKDGLPQNSLHRIIDDGLGHYWISGNNGIMRISKNGLNAFADGETTELQVLNFNEKDGMINREANGGVQSAGVQTSDGRLWFPNQGGITIINPYDFSADYGLDVPPPVFETIELAEGDIYIRDVDEIVIPLHQRDLRVNFAVPNFVNQDRLMFTYFLEGVNDRWQDATQFRQAVFTGVPPGKHILRIRSQFIGGEPVESSIILNIPPYVYETTWFGLFVVLGIIGILYTGFRIRIRSMEDTERKLQQRVNLQTEALQKAAEEKQRFFTGITHELKTPLSLIIGPLDDLMDENPLSSRLSMMHRNSYRLKNLVDQILDVSKLNADAVSLTLQPVDLPQFTRQIIGQFQSHLEQEHISVDIPTTGFDSMIYVDQEAWERIIINLMSNAIKFSPAGSTITISFVEQDASVEVRIKDQGPGIKPEHHQKIFDYLYQVEGAKASEGTGIGLFLVKGLIEEMGGSITLHSEMGAGTEFIVRLRTGHSHIGTHHTVIHEPRLQDGTTPAMRAVSYEDVPKKGTKPFEHRILVVEDNADFRTYLHSMLSDQYEVLLAENGKMALTLLETETPDLILSDIMMPEMNGLEFVHNVRQKKQFEHLPVIFLSAKNEDLDVQTGLSTGADVYLTKPIRSAMLLSQIVAVLRRERILQGEISAPSKAQEPEFLRQVREIIFRQLGNPSLNVNQLADALYMSRGKLYMEWKKVSEVSLNDYLKQTRLNEAKVLLSEKGFSVQEAARAVGFSDANYFSTSYKKQFGYSPTGK
jgi:signal transduction histidine kinase/DNA-binding response OmpR family regulator/ligand-binding sensor domain-containing protein